MMAYPILSDKIATTVLTFCVVKGEELAKKQFYNAYKEAVLELELLMIYTDGSKSSKGTAVAWTT